MYKILSHFCSSNADVSATAPSTTLIEDLSTYSPSNLASSNDVAGAISDGFRTTALPAAIAPMTGSRDNTGKHAYRMCYNLKLRKPNPLDYFDVEKMTMRDDMSKCL